MRAQDFTARVVVEEHKNDRTFSHNGKSDFTPESPEIYTISERLPKNRAMSQLKKNNSSV